MASSSVNTKKSFKGLESRKSHSWWWDSHIGPRNSKWLAENLEDMDQNYKRMLKLIEGDGDSFAKKAEMYYQRRPELLSHVEDFYRIYKLLAERYEHLTGELRKNLLADPQSHGFAGSDTGSEVTSAWPSQDPKMSRHRSGHRAAGFDFFLGSGRSSIDRYAKGDETSSLSDSETESDVSSLHSYPGISGNLGEEGLQVRTLESEVEPRNELKLRVLLQENDDGSLRRINSENFDDVHCKIIDYEEELKMGKEKICALEEEIANLKMEIQKSTSGGSTSNLLHEFPVVENSTKVEMVDDKKILELEESNGTTGVDISDPEQKIQTLVEELRITKGRLHALDKEVIRLRKENKEFSGSIQKMQDLLKMSQKDAAAFKGKLETEKRQASKLQERIARYKASLTDRENEVRGLKEVISDANRKYQLHAEISRLGEEKTRLEEKLREWEVHFHTLETQHEVSERKQNDEIEHLKADVSETTNRLETLKHDLDAYKLKYDSVMSEKDELKTEISARNDKIIQLEKHLQQLIAKNEGTCEVVEELRSRVEEMREEVERQKVLILEGAEGKREAIRQLCFSLEHYRNGYQQLRQAFMGHKPLHVFVS